MVKGITPNLWFDTEAEDAAEFYVSIFEDGKVTGKTHYTEAGPREPGSVMTVEWEINGQRFVGINGGPEFQFSEAVSFQITCDTQDEIDYFWSRLTDGGQEGQCGWLKDKFGLSWQVVPAGIDDVFSSANGHAEEAMRAMFKMKKLDIAELKRAAHV